MWSPYLEEGVNEEVGDWWVGSYGIQHVRPSVGEIEEQVPWLYVYTIAIARKF